MKRTTLILGAGASNPYGFPTGYELREEIIAELKEQNSTLSNCLRGQFSQCGIDAFAKAFERSQITSIDRFLAERPDHEEVGKAAIAVQLIRMEVLTRCFLRETRIIGTTTFGTQ